ncbi:MAG TPA: YbhB/YbcL family Raf kinase inhibitor-like protein [Burkholderiales bacterium]|nr:YbhB/YbcL family Raf kinase inhibitor-like protein [Burkholderiales bacterium]
MKLTSTSFKDMGAIPGRCAFAVPDAQSHIRLSDNRNPQLAWGGLPAGTRSLALVCHDGDVPSRADDVNQEGRAIPASLPRVDFYHWLLVDLKPFDGTIAEGEYSNGITARGKPGPQAPRSARQGLNDYTGWFAGDKDMAGSYFGYDGPCPPWNDTILHHYVFTLYALDVEKCPVSGDFRGAELLRAIEGHVLDSARLTGVYALNLAVKF